MTAWDDGPVKGGWPISISYRVHARLYWSLRPSTAAPPACSGLMYCGVPTTIPVSVSGSALAACRARAMPKSATTAWPAGQHDVLRLDVAMDDAVLVGVLQGAADFAGDLERGVERELLLPREPLPERLALGERHDVVEQAAGLSRVVQREDVGVLEGRGDLDLAEEPLAAEHGRQLGLEQLDGDGAAVLQVLGEEDDRHPAVAELPLDPVSIAERRPELLEEVHGAAFSGSPECVSRRRAPTRLTSARGARTRRAARSYFAGAVTAAAMASAAFWTSGVSRSSPSAFALRLSDLSRSTPPDPDSRR